MSNTKSCTLSISHGPTSMAHASVIGIYCFISCLSTVLQPSLCSVVIGTFHYCDFSVSGAS